jgi:predicted amino acid-binding ACT domain protein
MREIVLINITGKDKPGLTASLTKTLYNRDAYALMLYIEN